MVSNILSVQAKGLNPTLRTCVKTADVEKAHLWPQQLEETGVTWGLLATWPCLLGKLYASEVASRAKVDRSRE